jgi:hypothetical protein
MFVKSARRLGAHPARGQGLRRPARDAARRSVLEDFTRMIEAPEAGNRSFN